MKMIPKDIFEKKNPKIPPQIFLFENFFLTHNFYINELQYPKIG